LNIIERRNGLSIPEFDAEEGDKARVRHEMVPELWQSKEIVQDKANWVLQFI